MGKKPHFYEPEKITLNEGLAAWQHYLESGDLEISNKVATGLEDKLNTWGHWDLRRIICETMLEKTKYDPSLHAKWLHTTGILNQAQGDYDGAREQYQKSFEIKEKLGDLSGMASSYGQMGLLMRQLNRDQEAFGLFLRAFMIFARLKAPALQQSIGDLCRIVRANPDNWSRWLAELVEDEDSRTQIEELILQKLKNENNQQAKAIQEIKELYDEMGEEAFLEMFREKAGEDPPDELLEILRSGL